MNWAFLDGNLDENPRNSQSTKSLPSSKFKTSQSQRKNNLIVMETLLLNIVNDFLTNSHSFRKPEWASKLVPNKISFFIFYIFLTLCESSFCKLKIVVSTNLSAPRYGASPFGRSYLQLFLLSQQYPGE